jgi:hypothetical protein
VCVSITATHFTDGCNPLSQGFCPVHIKLDLGVLWRDIQHWADAGKYVLRRARILGRKLRSALSSKRFILCAVITQFRGPFLCTAGSCEHGNEHSGSIKGRGNFLTSWGTFSLWRTLFHGVGYFCVEFQLEQTETELNLSTVTSASHLAMFQIV